MARSFDISPGKQQTTRSAPPPKKPTRVTFRSARVSVEERRRQPGGVMPLRKKRRARKRKLALIICALLLILGVIVIIGLWRPQVRIGSIEASGTRADDIPAFVASRLTGTVYGVLPRNSTFFMPREELRVAILEAFPDIEAVSIKPTSLTTLSITAIPRARSFWWCGTEYRETPITCFDADTTGKIFEEVNASSTLSASTTPFIVYGLFEAGNEGGALGGVVTGAEYLPDMFRFVKALKELGANVTSVLVRGDEADLYTASGTRITYVLGHEQEALTLATTAFPSLDVRGNSLLYIDLRFTSKVYFKKRTSSQ